MRCSHSPTSVYLLARVLVIQSKCYVRFRQVSTDLYETDTVLSGHRDQCSKILPPHLLQKLHLLCGPGHVKVVQMVISKCQSNLCQKHFCDAKMISKFLLVISLTTDKSLLELNARKPVLRPLVIGAVIFSLSWQGTCIERTLRRSGH